MLTLECRLSRLTALYLAVLVTLDRRMQRVALSGVVVPVGSQVPRTAASAHTENTRGAGCSAVVSMYDGAILPRVLADVDGFRCRGL